MSFTTLRYPLRLAPLLAGLLLCAFAIALRLTYELTSRIGDMGFALWLALSGSGIFIYSWLMLEYCLDLIESSASGSEQAPGLRNPLRSGGLWDFPRALKLVVVGAIWFGLGNELHDSTPTGAWLLWGTGLLLLPAAMGQCALFDNFLQALNPLALLRCAIESRGYYLLALLLSIMLPLLCWLALQGSTGQFVLCALLIFYFLCLWSRLIGLGLRDYQSSLLQSVDFKTDRAEPAARSESLQQLDKVLTAAHELLRAGNQEQAHQSLASLVDAGNAEDFEEVFGYVSAWPYHSAGIYLADRQLPRLVQRQRFMRGLALLDWCLTRQADYAPADPDALAALAEQAATSAQYGTALQAIENVLTRDPALLVSHAGLKALCLDLAGTRLRDEKRYQVLQQRFDSNRS
jgi:hypothetical protein